MKLKVNGSAVAPFFAILSALMMSDAFASEPLTSGDPISPQNEGDQLAEYQMNDGQRQLLNFLREEGLESAQSELTEIAKEEIKTVLRLSGYGVLDELFIQNQLDFVLFAHFRMQFAQPYLREFFSLPVPTALIQRAKHLRNGTRELQLAVGIRSMIHSFISVLTLNPTVIRTMFIIGAFAATNRSTVNVVVDTIKTLRSSGTVIYRKIGRTGRMLLRTIGRITIVVTAAACLWDYIEDTGKNLEMYELCNDPRYDEALRDQCYYLYLQQLSRDLLSRLWCAIPI